MVKITVPAGQSDSGGRQPLPAGTYHCTVGKIDVDQTRSGHEWWRLRLGVVDGPHFGRLIFDSLYFTERAIPRAIAFCEALGLKLSANTEITPEMCLGRECLVTVQIETYLDREQNQRLRNAVIYDGYQLAPDIKQTNTPDTEHVGDDLPF